MGDLIVVDGMAAYFRILFIFAGLATVLFAWTSEEIMGDRRENKGEFFALTVLMTAAMMVMAEARDLLMLFLSMEAVGLTSYVMAGYMRTSLRSDRGVAEVRALRRGQQRDHALRPVPALRHDRCHGLRGHPRGPDGRPGQRLRPAGGHGAGPGRHELQDRRRALPLLVPGRLRRRAHPGEPPSSRSAPRPPASP